ncbi:hypothetical protein HanPI659440_Chr16g0629731 [Helianthus annuus]|nr:hypothetical protein HanPI659440_Chr16g0629731 [Helianthus annuus]
MQIWAKMHLLISHPTMPIRFLTLYQKEGRSDVTPLSILMRLIVALKMNLITNKTYVCISIFHICRLCLKKIVIKIGVLFMNR